jgi:ComF family protein
MRKWVDTCLDRLGGSLLPPRCVLCGADGQAPCLDLCRDCERNLPLACPAILHGASSLCASFAPFEYAHPVDHLVHALKYRGQLAVARVLGSLLGKWVAARGFHADVDVILPVPLHSLRHAERGFNQSAEIGRWVGRAIGRGLHEGWAARTRPTGPQVGLAPGERRTNVAGAFRCDREVAGLRIALVDDVTTTGSTLEGLADALRRAGAGSIVAWCVARTSIRTG